MNNIIVADGAISAVDVVAIALLVELWNISEPNPEYRIIRTNDPAEWNKAQLDQDTWLLGVGHVNDGIRHLDHLTLPTPRYPGGAPKTHAALVLDKYPYRHTEVLHQFVAELDAAHYGNNLVEAAAFNRLVRKCNPVVPTPQKLQVRLEKLVEVFRTYVIQPLFRGAHVQPVHDVVAAMTQEWVDAWAANQLDPVTASEWDAVIEKEIEEYRARPDAIQSIPFPKT